VHQPSQTVAELDQRSRYLRSMVIDALDGGGRGHVGAALSIVEIVRVLYEDVLKVRPSEPRWPDRDRFILSKGHGCLALYAMLAEKGFFPKSEIAKQCRPGALLGGHPELRTPGVEASTGALGHGLGIGVGMALAARLQGRPSRVFVLVGDGELNEGSIWESSLIASKHGLSNLCLVVDYNKMQSYGPVADVMPLEPLGAKLEAFGFSVAEVDGHDVGALRAVFGTPGPANRPRAIVCHTIKGRGIPVCEHNASWHHKAKLAPEQVAELRKALALT
jgi:transketolase